MSDWVVLAETYRERTRVIFEVLKGGERGGVGEG